MLLTLQELLDCLQEMIDHDPKLGERPVVIQGRDGSWSQVAHVEQAGYTTVLISLAALKARHAHCDPLKMVELAERDLRTHTY